MSLISRREIMRIGGISLAGLSLSDLMEQATLASPRTDAAFGRAKNIIFLYLNGGPPQHETFDPKPDAPAEVRGVYQPIQTNIPGIQFCELLPRIAALADKLAVVRSMATDDNIHSSSGHWVLTGNKYVGPNARTLQSTDWPYFGSLVKRYRPSEVLPALSTVMVPDIIRLNENVTPAGQTGGLMGLQWSPERFIGDPSRPDYKIEGLEPQGISLDRLRQRQTLQTQLEDRLRGLDHADSLNLFNTYRRQAFDLLTSGRAKKAFEIGREPDAVRERYGKNRWGQCVLLARRLIESGVRLVHVNWPREPGDNASDNPLWDTHAQNHDRLEDVLCPIFDVGFSALIEDLDQRGLLDETLVVAIGEFGRTPKINAKSGRDHWGAVFSFVMAGAGISGGQVYGSSDSQGAFPKTNRVEPGHMTATIFHLLGLDHQGTFTDPTGRELAMSGQAPIWELLGEKPATDDRVESTGDVARVPVFDETRFLASVDFQGSDILKPVETPSRPKGWRFQAPAEGLQVVVADGRTVGTLRLKQHLQMGLVEQDKPVTLAADSRLMLAQEVRSPFPGTYRIMVDLVGDGDSELFEKFFSELFSTHLVYFQFTDKAKQIDQRKVLAEMEISPRLWTQQDVEPQRFVFEKRFVNPQAGSNFSFGLGLGVGLEIRKKQKQQTTLPAARATLRVTGFQLEFLGKDLIKEVTV
jgi:hypothetical protein